MEKLQTSKVLFEIKQEHLETGLRGIPVGYCTTSYVDPIKGLYYKGYSISTLVERTPEEVMYLLLNDDLPTAAQLAEFNVILRQHAHLDPRILEHLKTFPQDTHPTKLFLAGLNLLGIYHTSPELMTSGYHIIGKLPELVAGVYHTLNADWAPMRASEPQRGYIENFIHMLASPDAVLTKLVQFMKIFVILHFDHGGGNLSTFVGKVVSSAHSELTEALIAAMCGLAGPLHGKANQEALRFLKRAESRISDPSNEEQVMAFIEAMIAKKEKIFGFGHAVLRAEDPRATILYALGEELCANNPTFLLAKTFRKVAPRVLSKVKKIANPYANVDAVSGCLLSALGLRDENFYTVLFGMARCVGITAQIFYERLSAREGRGTPITRPKYLYSGPKRS